MSIPVEYIETVETTADGEEIHIAHSGGDLEGSTVILDPVLQVSATDSVAVSVNHCICFILLLQKLSYQNTESTGCSTRRPGGTSSPDRG